MMISSAIILHCLSLVLWITTITGKSVQVPSTRLSKGCDKTCQKECLEVLNKYRANHDSPKLEFSRELANKAQKWADGGKFGYDMDTRGKYGQLIEWDVKDELPTFTSAIKQWHDKGKDFDFVAGKSKNGDTLHDFTQVVWKKAHKAGCGRGKLFGSRYYVVWMDADGVLSPNSTDGGKNVGPPKQADDHWFEITKFKAVGEPLYWNSTNATKPNTGQPNIRVKTSLPADEEDLNSVESEANVLNDANNIKNYVRDSLSSVLAEENREVSKLRDEFEGLDDVPNVRFGGGPWQDLYDGIPEENIYDGRETGTKAMKQAAETMKWNKGIKQLPFIGRKFQKNPLQLQNNAKETLEKEPLKVQNNPPEKMNTPQQRKVPIEKLPKTIDAGQTKLSESSPTTVIHEELNISDKNTAVKLTSSKPKQIKNNLSAGKRHGSELTDTSQDGGKEMAGMIMGKLPDNVTGNDGSQGQSSNDKVLKITSDENLSPDMENELSKVSKFINTRLKVLNKQKEFHGTPGKELKNGYSVKDQGKPEDLMTGKMEDEPEARPARITMVGAPLSFPEKNNNDVVKDIHDKVTALWDAHLENKKEKAKKANADSDGEDDLSAHLYQDGFDDSLQDEGSSFSATDAFHDYGDLHGHQYTTGDHHQETYPDNYDTLMSGPHPNEMHPNPGNSFHGFMPPIRLHPGGDWLGGSMAPPVSPAFDDQVTHTMNSGPGGLYEYRKKYTSAEPGKDTERFLDRKKNSLLSVVDVYEDKEDSTESANSDKEKEPVLQPIKLPKKEASVRSEKPSFKNTERKPQDHKDLLALPKELTARPDNEMTLASQLPDLLSDTPSTSMTDSEETEHPGYFNEEPGLNSPTFVEQSNNQYQRRPTSNNSPRFHYYQTRPAYGHNQPLNSPVMRSQAGYPAYPYGYSQPYQYNPMQAVGLPQGYGYGQQQEPIQSVQDMTYNPGYGYPQQSQVQGTASSIPSMPQVTEISNGDAPRPTQPQKILKGVSLPSSMGVVTDNEAQQSALTLSDKNDKSSKKPSGTKDVENVPLTPSLSEEEQPYEIKVKGKGSDSEGGTTTPPQNSPQQDQGGVSGPQGGTSGMPQSQPQNSVPGGSSNGATITVDGKPVKGPYKSSGEYTVKGPFVYQTDTTIIMGGPQNSGGSKTIPMNGGGSPSQVPNSNPQNVPPTVDNTNGQQHKQDNEKTDNGGNQFQHELLKRPSLITLLKEAEMKKQKESKGKSDKNKESEKEESTSSEERPEGSEESEKRPSEQGENEKPPGAPSESEKQPSGAAEGQKEQQGPSEETKPGESSQSKEQSVESSQEGSSKEQQKGSQAKEESNNQMKIETEPNGPEENKNTQESKESEKQPSRPTSNENQSTPPVRLPAGPLGTENPPTGSSENEKPPSGSSVNEKPPSGSSENEKPPSGSSKNEKPPSGSSENEKPPSGSSENEKPPSGSSQNEKPQSGSSENENPPSGSLENEKSPSGSSVNEKPPSGSSENEKPPSGSSENEKPPSGSSENEKPPSGSSENEKPPSGSSQNEKPQSGSSENEKPPSGSLENEKPPSGSSQNEKPQSGSSENEKPPSGSSENEKPPSGSSENEKPPSGSSENEKPPSGSSQNEKPQSGSSENENPPSGSLENEKPPSGSSQNEKPQSGSSENEKPPSGSFENEKPPSGSSQNEKPPSGSSENEKPPSGSSENEKPPSGSSENEKPPSGSSENEKPPSGSSQNEKPPSGSSENEKPPSGSSENEKPPSGSSENEKPPSGSSQNEKPQSGSSENEKPPSGSSENEKPPSGSSENEKPPSGSLENEKPLSGSSENEKPSSGSSENEKPPSGSSQNEKPPSGSTENEKPPSGSSDNQNPTSGSIDPSGTTENEKSPSESIDPTTGSSDNGKQQSGPSENENQSTGSVDPSGLPNSEKEPSSSEENGNQQSGSIDLSGSAGGEKQISESDNEKLSSGSSENRKQPMGSIDPSESKGNKDESNGNENLPTNSKEIKEQTQDHQQQSIFLTKPEVFKDQSQPSSDLPKGAHYEPAIEAQHSSNSHGGAEPGEAPIQDLHNPANSENQAERPKHMKAKLLLPFTRLIANINHALGLDAPNSTLKINHISLSSKHPSGKASQDERPIDGNKVESSQETPYKGSTEKAASHHPMTVDVPEVNAISGVGESLKQVAEHHQDTKVDKPETPVAHHVNNGDILSVQERLPALDGLGTNVSTSDIHHLSEGEKLERNGHTFTQAENTLQGIQGGHQLHVSDDHSIKTPLAVQHNTGEHLMSSQERRLHATPTLQKQLQSSSGSVTDMVDESHSAAAPHVQEINDTPTVEDTHPGSCKDDGERCSLWQKRGHCRSVLYAGFMKRHCKLTCGYCALPSIVIQSERANAGIRFAYGEHGCQDSSSYEFSCPTWKVQGYCQKKEEEMRRFCSSTCNFCKRKKVEKKKTKAKGGKEHDQSGKTSGQPQSYAHAQTGQGNSAANAQAGNSAGNSAGQQQKQPNYAHAQTGQGNGAANAQAGNSAGNSGGQQQKQPNYAHAQVGKPSEPQSTAYASGGNTYVQTQSSGGQQTGYAVASAATSPDQQTYAQAQSSSQSGKPSTAYAQNKPSSNSKSSQSTAHAQTGSPVKPESVAHAQTSPVNDDPNQSSKSKNRGEGKVADAPNSSLNGMSIDERVMSDSPEYKTSSTDYYIKAGNPDESAASEVNLYDEPPPIRFSTKNPEKSTNGYARTQENFEPGSEQNPEIEQGSSDDAETKAGYSMDDIRDMEVKNTEDEKIQMLMNKFDPVMVAEQDDDLAKSKIVTKTPDKKGTLGSVSTKGCDHSCQKECLDVINSYRRNHDVRPLVLNQDLAEHAQQWADSKTYGRSPWAQRGMGGELIAVGSFYKTFTAAVKAWHDEEKDFNWEKKELKKGKEIKHFKQLIVKDAHVLGCGKSMVNGEPYYIARMDAAENTDNKKRETMERPTIPDLGWYMESSPYWKDLQTREKIPRNVHSNLL